MVDKGVKHPKLGYIRVVFGVLANHGSALHPIVLGATTPTPHPIAEVSGFVERVRCSHLPFVIVAPQSES